MELFEKLYKREKLKLKEWEEYADRLLVENNELKSQLALEKVKTNDFLQIASKSNQKVYNLTEENKKLNSKILELKRGL